MGEYHERPEGPVIVTPVAEILARMESAQAAGFAEMRTSLSHKADRSDVEGLRGELRSHQQATEGRLALLEQAERERAVAEKVGHEHEGKFLTRTQRRWAIVGYVALILATAAGPVLATILHP